MFVSVEKVENQNEKFSSKDKMYLDYIVAEQL